MFVLLFMLSHQKNIHTLIHFFQTVQYFTNTPPHIPPASFIISITSRNAFAGFKFAAFSTNNISQNVAVMISQSLIESSMFSSNQNNSYIRFLQHQTVESQACNMTSVVLQIAAVPWLVRYLTLEKMSRYIQKTHKHLLLAQQPQQRHRYRNLQN